MIEDGQSEGDGRLKMAELKDIIELDRQTLHLSTCLIFRYGDIHETMQVEWVKAKLTSSLARLM